MKSLFLASIILCSTSVLATTCYKAIDQISSESYLPETICIESFGLSLVVPELPAVPFYKATVISDLGTITKQNVTFIGSQNIYEVEVIKGIVYNQGRPCTSSYSSSMHFNFKVNAQAQILNNDLSVTGVELSNNDICHSTEKETIIRYQAI